MENNTVDNGKHDLTPQERIMATKRVRTLVLTYSIPTIIGMLVNALYNVVDRFWVGRIEGVGSAALTGIGLCMPIMNVMMGLAMLVGIGAASNISIKMGARDKEGAEKILGNAFALIILLSALMTPLGIIFAEPILRGVGATDNTLPYALTYVNIIIGGGVFNFISFAMNHPIRASGNPRRFASTQLLGAVINIVLDPILIFNFDMGIAGAAWATIIAQAASAAWVMTYYLLESRSGGRSPINLRMKYLRLKLKVVLSIFSIGVSPFLMQIMASIISIVINRTLLHYGGIEYGNGDVAIGAMTVISSISTLFFMPIFGINQGSQPIIGFNYGARDYGRVKEAYKWATIYAVIITSAGFVLIQLCAPQLVRLFNDDQLLVHIASHGMRVMMMLLPIAGFQVTSTNFFQSIGHAFISVMLSLMRQAIVLVPMYLIMPLFFGFEGIWYAMPIADIAASILTAILIIREFKRLKVILADENAPLPQPKEVFLE